MFRYYFCLAGIDPYKKTVNDVLKQYDTSNWPTCIDAHNHYAAVSLEMNQLRNEPARNVHQFDLQSLASAIRIVYGQFRTCHLDFHGNSRGRSTKHKIVHSEL